MAQLIMRFSASGLTPHPGFVGALRLTLPQYRNFKMKESKETVCILTGVNLHKRLHLYQHPLLAKYTLIVLPCKIYNIYIQILQLIWILAYDLEQQETLVTWQGYGVFFPQLSDLTRKVQTSCQCSTNIGVTGRSRVDARRRQRSPNN